jgi:hypothetical protein
MNFFLGSLYRGTYATSVFCKNSRTTWKNLVEDFILSRPLIKVKHHEPLGLFKLCQMSAILELDPLNLWNFQKEGEYRNLLNLVERRGDEKSWTSNLMNYPSDIPVLEVTGSGELGWT